MRTVHMEMTALLLLAAAAGCGGTEEAQSTLTTVEVTPQTSTLFTVSPGNTVDLAVVGKDQDGAVLGGGTSTFTSANQAVATVSNSGTVTAVGAGTTQITISLTVGSVTKAGTATVTVQAAPASETVTAPQLIFTPGTVDVSLGGSVTWTIGEIHHSVDFTTAGAPSDIGEMLNESQSRTFTNNGSFNYHCTIHPTMTGVVRVH